MMNSNSSGRSSVIRYPFTASQWQELEHQALVYKYMVSGMPVPPDLLFTIRRSLDSSLSSKFLLHQPHHMGWNSFQMGFGRKIDPEPGRCRRTDGKKWRCSKEAYPDSKYCERHMHRGRNRSRKPVELLSTTTTNNNITTTNITTTSPPTAVPLTKTTFSSASNTESHLLYPHFSSSKPTGVAHHESTTNFFLENNGYSHSGVKDYRHAMKGDQSDELSFFSEASANSGTMRNNNDPWELSPLTMGSPQMKHKLLAHSNNSSGLQSLNDINSSMQQQQKHYYSSLNLERDIDQQPRKVMHHFLDEGPQKDKDSSNWLINSHHDQDKLMSSSHHKTQLSMSIPNSLHDFFMTQKW